MNLEQFERLLMANAIAGNATAGKSDPGVGKSSVSTQFAHAWAKYLRSRYSSWSVGLSVFFTPPASPISSTGLPWKSERTWDNPVTGKPVTYTFTDPAIPTWAMAIDLITGELRPVSCFHNVVLLIEEFGQGAPETKRSLTEIILNGGNKEHQLPEGSPRIVLSNIDARDGVTKDFDLLINRMDIVHLQWVYEIWHDRFADLPYTYQGREWQMLPESKYWAKSNAGVFTQPKPEKQGPWCTARSFTANDRFVQAMMELNDGTIPYEDPVFIEGCQGYIGDAFASYVNTLRFRLDIPTLEMIEQDPEGTPVPKRADLQMLLVYEMAARATNKQLDSVIQYISKRDKDGHGMPKDMSITFTKSLLRRSRALLAHPAVDEWIGKNAFLVSTVGSMPK